MPPERGTFSHSTNTQDRYITDYEKLKRKVDFYRDEERLRIVLTMGGFDFQHIGHFRYLMKAKEKGDLLIVGVDSDEKIRSRKGADRPIYPQDERIEMLTHLRHVDLVTLKDVGEPKWQLIKLLRPDVLIATEDTYKKDQLEALKEFCGEVIVLERQATTSTSAKIRKMNFSFSRIVSEKLSELLPELLSEKLTALFREHLPRILPQMIQDVINELVVDGKAKDKDKEKGKNPEVVSP